MEPSRRPPSHQKYRLNKYGGLDRPGGGVDLLCEYTLYITKEMFREAVDVIKKLLQSEDHHRISFDAVSLDD